MKFALVSTSFLLLLASEQGLAQKRPPPPNPLRDSVNICCGTGTPGPVGQRANWCEGQGGHMLCCNFYEPNFTCGYPFGAARKSTPGGAQYQYTSGNQCTMARGLTGWRMCAQDGSKW
ncbi:hypothetical protein PTNB73_08178 [Pyrenophora teres f. teres]|uniref:Secreted protein n=2 Tax=Pyrenophora teres f. teres TaxID=97479 RepID=E3RRJ6_PYRTT|nr:hypothetical protein PTT_11434 [Pyrenophora teres f. teres 0-1]KAE8826600.1 hypothetical protein HRS9139_07772 [Pyrenophora teres f. teres]KAE8832117.1 hypothetical protein PTNB85_06509 [Pyrenophora teres f. teres]KAE8837275.1 hypothetical protein HRS9122_07430 [Pyrenophora teres f. teres]KAE8855778.1 hypothetical protein PTNB29_08617 [Pyrenophora teres f. teres]